MLLFFLLAKDLKRGPAHTHHGSPGSASTKDLRVGQGPARTPRKSFFPPNTRAARRPRTAGRSPGWRAGEQRAARWRHSPGDARDGPRAPPPSPGRRGSTESDTEGARTHGRARRPPTPTNDEPPARPGGTLPRHGAGRRGPRPLGPEEQRPGPHRGGRQTHPHNCAPPTEGEAGRTGGTAAEDNGTRSEGAPLSDRWRRLSSRRWATPAPAAPRRAGRRQPRERHPRPIGRGKKRHLEHPRPGPAQAGLITNPVRHSPSGARAPQAPEAHGYTINGERDRTTPRPLDTPGTHHPGGPVASAQACARQADTPPTWGRHDTGSLPPAQRGTHGSPLLLPLDPPRLPRGTCSSNTRERTLGDRSNATTGLQAPEARPGSLQGPERACVEAGRWRGMPAMAQDPDPPPSPRGRRQESGAQRPWP
ncbi:basic proline-rich protein-like [Lepus europaeus]|uniref:basic proline-rich protein-like n=1 Tax=Lepus europaeus TaxID=9983 RepID=UPI002B478482|nr:basic proline-rich protein-like [Lepus europaeus]